jgi:hypothetical protein
MGLLKRVKNKLKELTQPVSYHSAFGDSGVRPPSRSAPPEEDKDDKDAELREIAEGRR